MSALPPCVRCGATYNYRPYDPFCGKACMEMARLEGWRIKFAQGENGQSKIINQWSTDMTEPRKIRTASPLVAATREFEKAHKRVEKARAAAVKVQNVTDELRDAEAAETAAYEALEAALEQYTA